MHIYIRIECLLARKRHKPSFGVSKATRALFNSLKNTSPVIKSNRKTSPSSPPTTTKSPESF